jgi:SAM-dependent methyltransferase
MHASPAIYNLIVHPKYFTTLFGERFLKPHFQLAGKKILEFGCGTGTNCTVIDPLLYLGVDIDEQRIECARRRYPNHSFRVVGATLDEIPAASHDAILLVGVLHHLSDRQIAECLPRFLRILVRGGSLIIFEPCWTAGPGISNWVMRTFDEGKFIRTEEQYMARLSRFFEPRVLKRFYLPILYRFVFMLAPRIE